MHHIKQQSPTFLASVSCKIIFLWTGVGVNSGWFKCTAFIMHFYYYHAKDHLMRRVDSLEKTMMLGGIGGRRRRGWPRMRWLDGITDSMDVSLSELQCQEPVWRIPPVTKVRRKEAWGMIQIQGFPLSFPEHLPPKTRVCLLYCTVLFTLLTFSGKKLIKSSS